MTFLPDNMGTIARQSAAVPDVALDSSLQTELQAAVAAVLLLE